MFTEASFYLDGQVKFPLTGIIKILMQLRQYMVQSALNL